MSLSTQFIDPKVLQAMDPELRSQIDRHFAVGFKQVEAKVAEIKLDRAKFNLRNVEKIHNLKIPIKGFTPIK